MSIKEVSANGWPASKNPEEIGVVLRTVIRGVRPVKVRVASACAPLLVAALKEWHKRVEKLEPGETQGYCYRPVRGTTDKLSNHSSASAVDIHPARHPWGDLDGNFSKAQQEAILDICAKYGLRSGGTYRAPTKKDWMHIEVNVTPAQAKALILKLGLK